jgi:uncharacterized protein
MGLPKPQPTSAALVTGASAGIGSAIARELARRGHGLVLVARRKEKLDELASELSAEYGIRAEAIGSDLSKAASRQRLPARVESLGLDVEILVNNAGFATGGPFADADPERELEQVRVLVEAPVALTSAFLPAMVKRGRGAILNVASTAAFQPLPGSACYAATKAFVLSLSEATHAELRGSGVTVTALCPGPVQTEFGEVAGVGSKEGQLPGPFWTSPEVVAREAAEGLAKGKRVVVPGLLNRAGVLGGQHVPRVLVLPIANRVRRAAL